MPGAISASQQAALVPNIVHWVSPGADGEPFPYWAFVNAAAIADVLRPNVFYFHHVQNCLPAGPWWDAVAPLLTLAPRAPLERVYGNPVHLLAHRSDVMRLAALAEYGGIYLDTDVLPLRSFAALLRNEFVIGIQGPGRAANAVMLASPHSQFAVRWLDAYHNFSGRDWDGHSVRLPWQLAERFPGTAVLLPRTAWFTPGPDDDPGYELFERDVRSSEPVCQRGNFAFHLWHQISKHRLDQISGPDWFHANEHTLYAHCLTRLAASSTHLAAALEYNALERS